MSIFNFLTLYSRSASAVYSDETLGASKFLNEFGNNEIYGSWVYTGLASDFDNPYFHLLY